MWVKIVNSSADPDSADLNSGGLPLGAAGLLPKLHSQYPGGGSNGGGLFTPDGFGQPPSLPGFSRKPRPPPPPPPPPLTPEQTTTLTEGNASQQEPTKGT